MNSRMRVRRRSNRTDVRPALLWLSLTALLLSTLGVGALIVHALTGEWLELKMESARVRVLEMLPKPAPPDFVPTPMFSGASASARPTIVWSAKGEGHTAPDTALPVETITVVVTPRVAQPDVAQPRPTDQSPIQPTAAPKPSITPSAAINGTLQPIQSIVQLTGVAHEAQRFNNCGPTTLRMYFSFYGYKQDTQVQIANLLKPNKDDRNVGPDELVGYAQQKGFRALARVNGDVERLKLFMSTIFP